MISRSDLQRSLVRAAVVRSLISLVFFTVYLLCLAATLPPTVARSGWMLVWLFGPPSVIVWLITKTLCRTMVVCPACGKSLWRCGTGNFKPRRMRVRDDAKSCPHCEAAIV